MCQWFRAYRTLLSEQRGDVERGGERHLRLAGSGLDNLIVHQHIPERVREDGWAGANG